MVRNLVALSVAALYILVMSYLAIEGAPWLLVFYGGLAGILMAGAVWWIWYAFERFGAVKVLDVGIEVVLLGIIGFLVLAFGGTLPWTWMVFNLLTALALALWGVKAVVQKQVSWAKTPLNLLALALLAFFFLQLLPLPQSVLGVFQSNTVKAYQYGPVFVKGSADSGAAAPLGPGGAGMFSISLNRAETRTHLFMWIGYAALFFTFINNVTRRRQVERMLCVIVLAAGATAVAGFATGKQDERLLYRQYSMAGKTDRSPILNSEAPREYSAGYGFERPTNEGDKVDWYIATAHTGDAFGGFPSSNSAATVLVMGLILSLGYLLALVATRREEWGQSGGLFHTREGNLTLLLGFLAVLCAAGLVMTKSRGALAVAAFLVPALVIWVAFSRSRLAGLVTLGAVVLVVVALVVLYSLIRGNVAPQVDALLNPFGEEVRMNARVSSWEMVGDFPLFGTGLGTYGDVFPAYKVRGPDLYFAHCDALQWFAETGLVGLALGLGILGVGFWTVVSGYRKLKDRFFRRLLIAVTVAAAAFLLHGLVDFPMEIPGVMIVFVALCAAAFVIARDQIARYEKDDFLY